MCPSTDNVNSRMATTTRQPLRSSMTVNMMVNLQSIENKIVLQSLHIKLKLNKHDTLIFIGSLVFITVPTLFEKIRRENKIKYHVKMIKQIFRLSASRSKQINKFIIIKIVNIKKNF